MIKINLLPHREAKRKQRKNAYFAMLALSAMIGLIMVLLVGAFFASQIANQTERNRFITAENTRLDGEIKEVATLKQEIDALKARQQAVEDLQSDRNQPVYLMDELVKQVPEGVYLNSLKQEGQRVALNGYAQSNERVSELLRNLSNNSAWLERPDLVEIRAAVIGTGRDSKHVFAFTVNVGIKRPSDKDAKDGAATPKNAVAAVAGTGAPAATLK
ncbi:PilN domain-containing protein [Collimonas pratensis]|uniref:Fimbrial assembly family protein n=1 Tax=Collimonas pratensis TaxID=279113 RepID=A0A127PYS3_9BURK|nr:PilN domain-containing protein [Collimonas pratensis]AMP02929.1 fimbrial assembly family protein [Collimonas pratensis]AMP12739.1 fimbrial assembly family protein [Collimonas pratensis]NKI71689.1 fimbrial assembly protein [Collimonas pratensis]